MYITLTDLPYMRSAYLVGMRSIVLYFIMLQHGILLNHNFHHSIGKTFTGAYSVKRFNYLRVGITCQVYQATWLREYITSSGICYVIQVYRMLQCLSLTHINKNTSMYKSSIQCIDTIFKVVAAMSKMLGNNIAKFSACSYFQWLHLQRGRTYVRQY